PQDTLAYIRNKAREKSGYALATVNLDHVVKLAVDEPFFKAYVEHDVVVADGFPIVWLGRLMGADIVRTTGADLAVPVMSVLEEENRTLALIGTTQEVLEEVTKRMKKRFPMLDIVFTNAPPFGFDPLSDKALDLMKQVEASGASVCLLAFGAPKQEILAAQAKKVAPHVGFISVGAALDFIAGNQTRAPLWVQRSNTEWLWRLLHNPKRLFWRYAQCAFVFPILLVRALQARLIKR
ncbi:MAG: WecB/TagA/CpsF family glycosyltransferase, partial [Bdellovibrionales bacterium]